MSHASASRLDEQITAALAKVKGERPREIYSNMGLKHNPFPVASITSPEYVSDLPPLRDIHLKTIFEFIQTTATEGRYSGLVVIGDYGFGKTHFLRWFEDRVNRISKGSLTAIYVRDPGASSRELLFAIVRGIGEESLRKKIWYVVQKALSAAVKEKGIKFFEQLRDAASVPGQTRLIEEDPESYGELVSETSKANLPHFLATFDSLKLSRERLQQFFEDELRPLVGNLAVAEQLASFVAKPQHEAYRSWVALASGTQKKLPVLQDDYFRAIIGILKANEASHTYLLLDEFEDVAYVRLTPRKTLEYAAGLRMLIDTNLTDFSLVVAMTAAGFDAIKEMYPPLNERLNFKIELSPLTEFEVETLISRYLDTARVGDQVPVQPLSPFSKEVVRKITELSRGNTRTVVTICHRLIEICAQSRSQSITLDMMSQL
jgi:hypothetical protein